MPLGRQRGTPRWLLERRSCGPRRHRRVDVRDRFAQPLVVILCVVGAVLLITCANIANLMLARAASRRHEMTVRLALGASRLRLACQVFVESLLLAGAGAAAGLAVAQPGASLLLRQLGRRRVALDLSRLARARVHGRRRGRRDAPVRPRAGTRAGQVTPGEVLKEHSRTVRGDRRWGFRSALVVVQIAISFALVAGAGLFVSYVCDPRDDSARL